MKLFSTTLASASLVAVLLLGGCVSESPWGQTSGKGQGQIALTVNGDARLDMGVELATRATTSLTMPPKSEFSVTVTKADGTYNKKWNSMDDFLKEAAFPVGTYNLTVAYGNPTDQGHCGESGYENAYFTGKSETFQVIEDKETDVSVEAALGNAAVQVEYGEAFRKYFKAWSTTLTSAGNEPVELGSSTDMHFITPSQCVDVSIAVAFQNGRTATIRPASFVAEAKHLHRVVYDVANGGVGEGMLSISFPDNLTTEDIFIDLSGQLVSAEVPVVTVTGFSGSADNPMSLLHGTAYDKEIGFIVKSASKIKKAELMVVSTGAAPAWAGAGGKVTVIENGSATAPSGIAVSQSDGSGALWTINLQNIIKDLSAGIHKFYLTVTDDKDRTNADPLPVVALLMVPEGVTVTNVSAPWTSVGADGKGQMTVDLSYNGGDPMTMDKDPFSFNILTKAGYNPARVLTIDGKAYPFAQTRSGEPAVYRYALEYDDNDVQGDKLGVEVYFNGEKLGDTRELEWTFPAYTLEIAEQEGKEVKLRVKHPGACPHFGNHLKATVNGEDVTMTLDRATGLYTISGLTVGASCHIETKAGTAGSSSASVDLTTEAPETYTLVTDAFAKSVRFKVNGSAAHYGNALKATANGTEVSLTLDEATGIYTAAGLEPSTSYTLKTWREGLEDFPVETTFTTEAALDVPNGDFENLSETINKTINQGGEWTITALGNPTGHQTTLTMLIKEPSGWSSSNSVTCNLGSSILNSWFVVPSVYNTSLTWISNQPDAKVIGAGQSAYKSTAEIYKTLGPQSGQNAMVIRNVAWDANGKTPSKHKQTGNTDFSNYYCANQPEIANRSKGELRLGSSSSEGTAFQSRPVKLTGYYQYANDSQDAGEKGVAKVEILSDGVVTATGNLEFSATSSYTRFEVPLAYTGNFGQKATHLKIYFSSSNKASDITTTNYCNKDECVSRGAMLTIDNLTFEY